MPPQDDDVRESRQAIDNLLDEIPTVPKIQTATGFRQRPNPRRSKRPYASPRPPSRQPHGSIQDLRQAAHSEAPT